MNGEIREMAAPISLAKEPITATISPMVEMAKDVSAFAAVVSVKEAKSQDDNIATEMATSIVKQKEFGMPTKQGELFAGFVKKSAQKVKNYLSEAGMNVSQLVDRPVEAVGKILNIDSQTARSMLKMLGVQVDSLRPVVDDRNGVFERNAVATELIGSMLYASGKTDQVDKSDDRPVIPQHVKSSARGAQTTVEPMISSPRRKIKYPVPNITFTPRDISIKGRHRRISIPHFSVKLVEGEIGPFVIKPPTLPKMPHVRIPWGKVGLGVGILLVGYWTWYGIGGGSGLIEPNVPTPTPTRIAPIPTRESFSSELLRITLPNYANGMTSIDFMNVNDGATQNMTANAVSSDYPADTWMWSRKTDDSLDFYRKTLGDNTITQNDINRFRSNPQEFINWLRMNGKTDQADFYQYRLTGDNGFPPSAQQFEDWVKKSVGK